MKNILFIALLFTGISGFGQFSLTNNETGQSINNGDIIYGTNAIATHVIATNTSGNNIYLTLEVLDIINTDGTEMQYCFGVDSGGNCYFGMNVNDVKQGGNPLAPGASTRDTDIDFKHTDNPSSFPNYPKDYVVKIFASDSNGGAQIGNAITFTFRYDPNASSINPPEKDMVNYFVSGKTLNVFAKENLSLKIYNLTGKLLYQNKLAEGNKKIYLNNFSTGIYIIEFSNEKTKILRKFILK